MRNLYVQEVVEVGDIDDVNADVIVETKVDFDGDVLVEVAKVAANSFKM